MILTDMEREELAQLVAAALIDQGYAPNASDAITTACHKLGLEPTSVMGRALIPPDPNKGWIKEQEARDAFRVS